METVQVSESNPSEGKDGDSVAEELMEFQEEITFSSGKICTDMTDSSLTCDGLIEEIVLSDDDDQTIDQKITAISGLHNEKRTSEASKKRFVIMKKIKLSDKSQVRSNIQIKPASKTMIYRTLSEQSDGTSCISVKNSATTSNISIGALKKKDNNALSKNSPPVNKSEKVLLLNTSSNLILAPILSSGASTPSANPLFISTVIGRERSTQKKLLVPKTATLPLAAFQPSTLTGIQVNDNANVNSVPNACTKKSSNCSVTSNVVIRGLPMQSNLVKKLANQTYISLLKKSNENSWTKNLKRDSSHHSSRDQDGGIEESKLSSAKLDNQDNAEGQSKTLSLNQTPQKEDSSTNKTAKIHAKSTMRKSKINVAKEVPFEPIESVAQKPDVVIAKCLHPTCIAYSEGVEKKLKIRLADYNRKIKALRMAKFRQIKRTDRLQEAITALAKQKTKRNTYDLLPNGLLKEILGKYLKDLKNGKSTARSSAKMKDFAVKLHSISPTAYDLVQNVFKKAIPPSNSVHDWYNCADEMYWF